MKNLGKDKLEFNNYSKLFRWGKVMLANMLAQICINQAIKDSQ